MIEWKGTNTGIWLNLPQEEDFKEQPGSFKAANDIKMTEFLPMHPVYLRLVINFGDGIPVELFQILKDDTEKVLHSVCQKIWKTQQWQHDCKMSVFIPIPKKGSAKESSNYYKVAFISHASKANLKILQARLQQYVNCEHPDVQAGFRKGRGTRDQIAKSVGSSKKQESSRIISIFALMTMPKSLTVWTATNCGKFLKRWEYQTTWPDSWEICMQVKKKQLEPYVKQHTVSKLGKEYIKAVYCYLSYLTYMQSTWWEMPNWMN